MVTVLEGICADGTSLSRILIYKAHSTKVAWVDKNGPADVIIGHSAHGWTDNTKGLGYLQTHFGPRSSSAAKAEGKWRMIIFDGHESHVSWDFLQYCIRQKIIAFCLLPHSTNILQPLDVAVSPYKNYYSQILEHQFWYGRLGVTKESFWPSLAVARAKGFTEATIKSAFAFTSIWPLDEAKVLKKIPADDPACHFEPGSNTDSAATSNTAASLLSIQQPTIATLCNPPIQPRTPERD